MLFNHYNFGFLSQMLLSLLIPFLRPKELFFLSVILFLYLNLKLLIYSILQRAVMLMQLLNWQWRKMNPDISSESCLADWCCRVLCKGRHLGFPGGASGKEPACQFSRHKRQWVWSPRREDPLEEGRAAHSSVPAWRIPRTERPGRLPSTGSQRVGHDGRDLAYVQAKGETHTSGDSPEKKKKKSLQGKIRGEGNLRFPP